MIVAYIMVLNNLRTDGPDHITSDPSNMLHLIEKLTQNITKPFQSKIALSYFLFVKLRTLSLIKDGKSCVG